MPGGKRKRLDICRDCKRSTRPAITAARLGHSNCLTTAYRELGVFNERDDYGATPIHFAARNGHLDCLKWLVTRSGVSPNAVSRSGATAAHDAAAMGHLACLHYLLENTACTASDTTVEGATVLHIACRFGRLHVVKWLMDYSGARPSEKGANDVTPVHLCAAKNHLQCLQWLTRHDEYVPNERTVNGATAVYFAAQEGSIECQAWLVNEASGDPHMMAEDGMSPIHAAAQAGHIPCLTFLTSLGVSIRQPAEDGATPAHFAAASGQVETLEWILDHGGSALDKDNLGGTPAHDAAEQGQVDILSALIHRGAPTHYEDYEGLRPLDLAKDNQHSECVKLLFKTSTPTLLTSVTPHHSMTRASGTDNNEMRKVEQEKQKRFESALLAGVSEERRQAMWTSAEQQAATGPQPGLQLLLDGQTAASPSQLSLTAIPQEPLLPPPSGSTRSRRSTHRSSRRATSSVKMIDDDVDMLPYKPRPVLSPSLFDGPPQDIPDVPSMDQPHTKKIKTDADKRNGMEHGQTLGLEQRLNVAKATTHKASPIPQRAKFLRKFNVGGKKKTQGAAATTQEGVRGRIKKGPPQEVAGRGEVMELEEREDVTANTEPQPHTRQPVREMKVAAMQAGHYRVSGGGVRDSSNPYDMVEEELVSGALKDSLVAARDRGPTDLSGELPTVTVDPPDLMNTPAGAPPSTSPPPPSPPLPSSPTPHTVADTSAVVLRQKKSKQKLGPVQEKAVILKQKVRKSLKTPDETVTVNFVPQQSNVKQSFPVTHAQLLKDDDLSSPGSTSEEDAAVGRGSSTTFEKLDLQTFEKFGQDVHQPVDNRHQQMVAGGGMEGETVEMRSDSGRVREKREGRDAEERKERDSGESGARETGDTEREARSVGESAARVGEGREERQHGESGVGMKDGREERDKDGEARYFQEVDTSSPKVVLSSRNQLERAVSAGDVKRLDPAPPLKKWDNVHSLEQIGRTGGEGVGRLKSVAEEDEDNEQQQYDDKQPHYGKQQHDDKQQELQDYKQQQLYEHNTNIHQFGSIAVYYKQAERRERGGGGGGGGGGAGGGGGGPDMDILKRISQIEEQGVKSHPLPVRGVRLEMVKSGSVSEKLKMFGGGRRVTRTVSEGRPVEMPPLTVPKSTTEQHAPPLAEEVEDEQDDIAPLPNIERRFSRRQSEEKLRLDGLPSLSPPRERRDKPHTPSPSINEHTTGEKPPPLSRGYPKSPSPPSLPRHSPPLGRLRETDTTEEGVVVGGVSPTQKLKRRNSSGVYSPLIISTDASDIHKMDERVMQEDRLSQERPLSSELDVTDNEEVETKRRSLRDERARRQLFALSADGKVGSRESAYMGWGTPNPQMGQLKQRWKKEAGEVVRRRVQHLLSPPRLTGSQVPFEFRGLQPQEPGRMTVWKQKAGSLQRVVSLDAITFEDNNIFIFLKEPLHGPILHHIYLWLGRAASELSVSSAHQHCQQLMHCLPGGCPLHKETQGHESGGFMSILGVGVASRLSGSTPYVNTSLEAVTLYNLNVMFMSFQATMSHPPSHSDLIASPSPSLLNTHTRVWVWLPTGYWGNQTGSTHYQKSVVDIGQSFLAQKGYPKWAPVTVLTQHCETLQFVSHFSAWPNLNFDLAPPTWRPIVKNLRLLELSTPTRKNTHSDTKIFRVEGSDRRPLPPVPSSHLSASGIYMFQWTLRHASPLYMWIETAVCVWVGSRVADYWAAVDNCGRHVEKEMPLMLVPSGQEPPQLLSFFQGHLVIHSSPRSSPHPSPLVSSPHRTTTSPQPKTTHLYRVSGSSLQHMKAVEVPPTSSSLCSDHCYILSSPPLLFSWSGHLSSKDTRTGALYIAQILNSSHKPLLVAEGQEGVDFWKCLGGKTRYQHFDSQKFPSWAPPELYCCLPSQHHLTFTQLPPAKKKDLRSSSCYILWFRNQLFVWVGSQWKHHHFTNVVKAYLSQGHSGCTARDFVVMVVHEGHEGEEFWQWFELQRCLEPKAAAHDVLTQSTPTEQETTPTNQDETTPKSEGKESGVAEMSDDVKGGAGGETGEDVTDGAEETPAQDVLTQTTHTWQETTPTNQYVTTPTSEGRESGVAETSDDVNGGAGGDDVTDGAKETPAGADNAADMKQSVATTDNGAVNSTDGIVDNAVDKEGDSSLVVATVAITTGVEDDAVDGHVTSETNQIEGSKSMESVQTPSVSSLLTQPEDLEEIVSSKHKERHKKASIRAPQMLAVRVEVEGGRTVEVTLREGAPVITVMFRVAEAAGLTLVPTSSLFEIAPQLKLHRPLEEHEVMKDVMSQWPSGRHKPKLLLRTFLSKNMLWEPNPPIPKSATAAYLSNQIIPELKSELHYCPRATKLQWKKEKFQLGEKGIYIISRSGSVQVCAGLDHHLYIPTPNAERTLVTPTRFCFGLKPASSWKLKDVKLFCSSDLLTMAKWVHGMRLLQHGNQLKANKLAMKQRLQKRENSKTDFRTNP